jgi:hypothetical protein
MNASVLDRANEAVFYFQYNTKKAVEYVVKNSETDSKTAKQALMSVMTYYKNKS